MKILLLLFFSFGTSLALFLWTLLYSGHTRETIKKALADSPVYTQISDHFAKQDKLVMEQDQYPYYVSKRFSPEYFRNKTESVLDDSAAWITGRSQNAPVLSFKELKDDLQQDHPDLISAIEQVPSEKQLVDSGLDETQTEQYLNQAKQMQTFSKSDFAIQLSQYLQSVKIVYNGLKIALPILIVILLLCLMMIWLLSEGTPRKFKWVGVTLLVSSMGGYGFIFVYHFSKDVITHFNLADQSEFVTLVAPIITTVLYHYISVYLSHQALMSTLFLIIGTCCLVVAFLTRHQSSSVKPLKVNASFWRGKKKK